MWKPFFETLLYDEWDLTCVKNIDFWQIAIVSNRNVTFVCNNFNDLQNILICCDLTHA